MALTDTEEHPNTPLANGRLQRSVAGFKSTFSILADSNYRWYWLATLGYYTGLRMEELARSWLAYDMTQSATMLGIVLVSQGLPHAIIGAVGGTLADRVPKRTLLLWMQGVLTLEALAMLFLVATDLLQYWHIAVLATVYGTAVGLSLPARLAYVAEVVPEHQFVRAYGLYYVALNTMRIGGPALGGLLMVGLGVEGAYVVIAAVQFSALLALLRVRDRVAPPAPSGKSFVRDMADAFAYARQTPTLLILIVAEFGKVLFATPARNMLPVFAGATVFAVGVGGLGNLQAALGAGALIGSVIIALAGSVRRKALLLLLVGLLEGATLLLFGSASVFALALLFIAVIGVWSAVYTTLESTLFQLSATPEMRGRVMGIRMFAHAIEPIGVLPMGIIADAVGVQVAVTAAGALLVVFMLAISVAFPAFRRLETGGMVASRH